jgi:hypothetical protein
MRARYVFAVGIIVLIAGLLLPVYQEVLAACGTLVIIGIVAVGFAIRPRRDVFYLQTSSSDRGIDGVSIEHGRIAIRVELTRLWILFVPTFLAVAFLILTWARDSTLRFDLVDVVGVHGVVAILFSRLGVTVLLIVVGILSEWISERWTLRDATACSARSLTINGGRVSYSFVDDAGEYYGGHALVVAKRYPPQLANVVLYNLAKPELNRIAIGCLFHRLVIIGDGLTDLDQATVQARLPLIESTM